VVETDVGRLLALTSWAKLLSAIETELTDGSQSMNDLLQLRALCDAAGSDAFVPISSTELTNQRTPAFVLQLNSIVQRAVDLGVTQGVLSIERLRPVSSWERIGRYISFPTARGVGAWIGTDLDRWRRHGGTPLWLLFSSGEFGCALEVRALLEPWAGREGVAYATDNEEMAVGIDLATGEHMDLVAKSVVDRLRAISVQLSGLS
jgi:hypothetical protein